MEKKKNVSGLQTTPEEIAALMEGGLLHALGLTKNHGELIALELDEDFTPLQVRDNKIIAKDRLREIRGQ